MSPTTTSPSSSLKSSILTSPTPTPHWGVQSWPAFTISASNTIKASPLATLSALVDTAAWPEWNNFVPRASITSSTSNRLQPGTYFTEHVDMSGKGSPSRIQKMYMSTEEEIGDRGYRVIWVGKQFPDWALRSERVHEIQEQEAGPCVYHCYETMSGPLAFFVRVFVGAKLVQRFGQWNRELGQYAEKRQTESG